MLGLLTSYYQFITLPKIIYFEDSSTKMFSFGFCNSASVRTVVQYILPGCNFKVHGDLYLVSIPAKSVPDLFS